MTNIKTTVNAIPEIGFESSNNQRQHERAEISFRVSGVFTLSHFSLIQLIDGFTLLIKSIKEEKNYLIDCIVKSKMLENYQKLLIYLEVYGLLNNLFLIENKEITLTREQVLILVEFLSARMKHCENERAQNSDKFNSSTYIGQKLLLLELKEWLSVEIVTEPRIVPNDEA